MATSDVDFVVRPSDTSGKIASYLLNVAGGNSATAPTCALVNAPGSTGGGATNDPSFTFTMTSGQLLRASPAGLTAGTFFFDAVALGSALPR